MASEAGSSERQVSGRVFWVAALALAAWAGFTVVMINRAGAQGPEGEILWTRLAWLFSSVEAVAFGAAGAIFGASVQRERAEKAEQRADTNTEAAANGKALAGALVADEPATPSGKAGLEAYGPQAKPAAAAMATRHAALARQLFPSVDSR